MTRERNLRIGVSALLTALSLAAAWLLPATAQAEPVRPRGRQYALLVGVSRYKNNSLRPLQYTDHDAEALRDLLVARGYKSDNVWLMTHKEATRDPKWFPTRENILDNLRLMVQGLNEADSVIVALAGHGVQFKGSSESYFCPADADVKKKTGLLGLSEVYAMLRPCKAGVKLVVVDACRNDPLGDGARSASINLSSPLFQKQAPAGGLAVLFSCAAGEEAFEDRELKHGVFTHFLLKGLGGEAADRKGRITLFGLAQYLTENVNDYARNRRGETQRPTLVVPDGFDNSVALLTRSAEPKPEPRTVTTLTETRTAAPTSRVPAVRPSLFKDRSLVGHNGKVTSVVLFPDGERAASGSFDGTVRVWNLRTGQELACLKAERSWNWAVAVSPNGRYLLSGGDAMVVLLWDVESGKLVRRFEKAHAGPIAALAFSPDGTLALSGGVDRSVVLWKVETGEVVRQFRGHEAAVTSVAFSPRDRRILSSAEDGTVRLWDSLTGSQERLLRVAPRNVEGVLRTVAAFTPQGQVVTGGADGNVQLWAPDTGHRITSLQNSRSMVMTLAVSADGSRVLTGDEHGVIRAWDLKDRKLKHERKGEAFPVTSLALSADGQGVLCGGAAFSGHSPLWMWRLN